MNKGKKIKYLAIAILVVFVAIFVYQQMNDDGAAETGTSIETATLETGDIVQTQPGLRAVTLALYTAPFFKNC